MARLCKWYTGIVSTYYKKHTNTTLYNTKVLFNMMNMSPIQCITPVTPIKLQTWCHYLTKHFPRTIKMCRISYRRFFYLHYPQVFHESWNWYHLNKVRAIFQTCHWLHVCLHQKCKKIDIISKILILLVCMHGNFWQNST